MGHSISASDQEFSSSDDAQIFVLRYYEAIDETELPRAPEVEHVNRGLTTTHSTLQDALASIAATLNAPPFKYPKKTH